MKEFIQLANGDVWLPPGSREGAERKDTATDAAVVVPDAREEAIEAASADPLRPNITCPWCQHDFPNEEIFNDHVRVNHASALGLSAEVARNVEESRILRQKAQGRIDAREHAPAEDVIQQTMDGQQASSEEIVAGHKARVSGPGETS